MILYVNGDSHTAAAEAVIQWRTREQEEAIAKSGMWVRSTDVGNSRSEVS